MAKTWQKHGKNMAKTREKYDKNEKYNKTCYISAFTIPQPQALL
jgi:hypothetical protein